MTRALLLCLSLVLACDGCAVARTPEPAPTEPRRKLGIATCEEYAEGWVSLTALEDSMTAPGIIAHEADHKLLIGSFPGCQEWRQWKNATPLASVLMEARAFCAHAIVDYRRGLAPSVGAAIRKHALNLAAYDGFNLDARKAEALIRAFCGGAA